MIVGPHYITTEEYLDIERQSPTRHEYRRGLAYAMTGGTDNHDRIAFNFLRVIDNHLGDTSDCRFFSGNVKVNRNDQIFVLVRASRSRIPLLKDASETLALRYTRF